MVIVIHQVARKLTIYVTGVMRSGYLRWSIVGDHFKRVKVKERGNVPVLYQPRNTVSKHTREIVSIFWRF